MRDYHHTPSSPHPSSLPSLPHLSPLPSLSPRLCQPLRPRPSYSPCSLHQTSQTPSRLLAGGKNSSLLRRKRDLVNHLHQGTGGPPLTNSWTSFSRVAVAVQANATCSLTGSITVTRGMRPMLYHERSWTWWCLGR